jgi:DNA-binding transcriptional LysR family regulator
MAEGIPHISTDQARAFVEVARQGQIRAAASVLAITEQGLRNRLLALEAQLGVELYRKIRGPRRLTLLTDAGHRFLPHALAFLERAREMYETLAGDVGRQEVRVVASQYLIRYLLIDVLKDFAKSEPNIHVRASTMNERDVEDAVMSNPEVAFGLAAPYEQSPDLEYQELFAMTWNLIVPRGHRLAGRRRVKLEQLVREPLILYERGSTGRQHVLDAFYERGLSPLVTLETTATEIVVSMVEAGLGIAIVPLLPSGAVTRGRRLAVVALDAPIRPIHSGVLLRRRETLTRPAARLLEFTKSRFAS